MATANNSFRKYDDIPEWPDTPTSFPLRLLLAAGMVLAGTVFLAGTVGSLVLDDMNLYRYEVSETDGDVRPLESSITTPLSAWDITFRVAAGLLWILTALAIWRDQQRTTILLGSLALLLTVVMLL